MVTVSGQKENQPVGNGQDMLSSGELKMMLGQCLKMASENKITAHNTWGLPLIEHLDDLIQEEGYSGRRTNFQKASVTLDAGVKIYSYRVDSVHTETFKMLGGLGRAGIEEDGPGELGDGGVGHASPSKRKRRGGDLHPESTLESSIEALNVKKFDLAFAVDPLFHKTSAQFDAGGAHGLLLNNLSVYQGCNIVFDSMDIPDRAVDSRNHDIRGDESSACIRGEAEGMNAILEELDCVRIAPILDDITNIASASGSLMTTPAEEIISRALDSVNTSTTAMIEDVGSFDAIMGSQQDDHTGFDIIDSACYDDDDGQDVFYNDDNTASIGLGEEAIHWLVNASLDSKVDNGKNTSWTGASHWKYRGAPSDSKAKTSQRGSKNAPEPIDFTILMEIENPNIPLESKRRRKKTAGTERNLHNTKTLLPEDYRYSVDMLGKYSLRPDYVSLLRSRHGVTEHGDYDEADYGSWGPNDGAIPEWGDEDSNALNLAQASHKVEQVEVSYCKAAKQVDVKALKELMWRGINMTADTRVKQGVENPRDNITFADVLSTVPEENHAGRLEDLSVHLCFICVLHLANEHGLVIEGVQELNQLIISNVPASDIQYI